MIAQHDTSYYLTRLAAGGHPRVELTQEEFAALKEARNGLVALTDIEDKLDLLMENLAALEMGLLEIALRFSLFNHNDYAAMMNDRQQLNLHLVNFLSTARLYIDQVQHDVSGIFGATFLQSFREQLSHQYDSRLAYRVMEALRNLAQHRRLPVDGTSVLHQAEREGTYHVRVSARALLDLKELAEDGKIKKDVLRELEHFAAGSDSEDVDLAPFAREYVQAIGTVHEWLRTCTNSILEKWKTILMRAFEQAEEVGVTPADALGVVAITRDLGNDDSETWSEEFHLSQSLYERMETLRKKNCQFERLTVCYVAGIGREKS